MIVEVVRRLIRNACVNDGTADSGFEHRSVDTLSELLGRPDSVYEPHPGRQSGLWRIPGGQGPSLMLMGHLDVVPANPAGWSHDPYAAVVDDGFVWGRGAVDMLNLTGSMAVVFDQLRTAGSRPPGDLLFLAVADEEAGGVYGAKYLTEHHWGEVAADYLLTEIAYPAVAGVPTVNVGEKGPLWRVVSTRGTPGHASQPFGSDNALVRLARVLAALAEAPAPVAVSEEWREFVSGGMFDPDVADALVDPDRLEAAIEDLAAGDPLLARYVHACTHMTIAPTILHSGGKANVIPEFAEATIDVRALPGQDGDTFSEHLAKVVGDDADHLEVEGRLDHPATASAGSGPLWEALGDAHEALSGEREMLGVLTPAATDARFWRTRGTVAYGAGWFDDRVEFGEFLSMFHGHDERISVESLERTTAFLAESVRAFWRRTTS